MSISDTGLLLAALADERSLRAKVAELEAALAEAREDNEELDGTDAAKPAWWRGYEYGVAQIVRSLTELMDGKEPSGKCSEPYETLRRRVWEAVEDSARIDWANANSNKWGKRTDWIGNTTGEWWAIDGPGPGTHATLRDAIDSARGKP